MRDVRRGILGLGWMAIRRILVACVNLVILVLYLLSGGLRKRVLADMKSWRLRCMRLS